MNDSDKKCPACGKVFTQKKNIYAHLRKVHQIEPLESKPEPKFDCSYCDKKFSCQSSLSRHTRQTHNTDNEHDYSSTGSARKVRLICPHDICNEKFLNYVKLREHLLEQHDVIVEYEDLTFTSTADFEQWKDEIQQKTLSLYTQDTAMKLLKCGDTRIFYNCHRSYCYKNKGKNIRATKSIGSNKIGKACPSRLEVTSTANDGESTVSVKYWKTHCGHTEQIERITLNKDVRLKIAGKLKEGVSFDRVLDSIRDSKLDDNIPPRVLLLNRKDMHNIVRDFNINYATKRHQNDAITNNNEVTDLMGMKRLNVDINSKNNVNLVNKTELFLGLIKAVSLSDEDNLAIEEQLDRLIESVNKAKLVNLDIKENVIVNKRIDKQKRLCKGKDINTKDIELID